MNPKVKKALQFSLFLGIGAFLLFLVFRKIDLWALAKDIQSADFGWVAVSLTMSVIANAFRALRWGELIEPFHKRPAFKNMFRAVNSGYLANLAFPRLGEITRCTVLYEVEGPGIDALVGTVIVERVIDVLLLLVVIFLTIISNVGLFGHFFLQLAGDKLQGLAHLSALKISVLLGIALVGFLALWLLRKRLLALPLVAKVLKMANGLLAGLRSVAQMKRPWVFVFQSLMIWVFYYLAAYFSMLAMTSTHNLGFTAALLVLTVGSIGMSAPVQGGFGAYHFMVASGLALYGLQNGLSYASLAHSATVLLMIVQGTVGFIFLNIEKRKQLKIRGEQQ